MNRKQLELIKIQSQNEEAEFNPPKYIQNE